MNNIKIIYPILLCALGFMCVIFPERIKDGVSTMIGIIMFAQGYSLFYLIDKSNENNER